MYGSVKAISGNVPVINVHDSAVITAQAGTSGNANDDASNAIYGAGFAIFNLSGGSYTASEALSVKSGIYNITGGTYRANGTFVDPVNAYTKGSEASGSAISITANKNYARNVQMAISDATVISENGYGLSECITSDTQTAVKSLKIMGGNFAGAKGAVLSRNLTGFIEGGKFNTDVTAYLANDKLVSKEVDGKYLVGEENPVTISSIINGKVTADKAKAIAGETVTLTVSPDDEYLLKKLTVVDGNGRTVKVTDNKFIMPDSEATVSAKFEKVTLDIEIPEVDKDEGVKEPTAGATITDDAKQTMIETIQKILN